eukprot:evm.model.NODE_32843_length_3634_cov_31.132360.1
MRNRSREGSVLVVSSSSASDSPHSLVSSSSSSPSPTTSCSSSSSCSSFFPSSSSSSSSTGLLLEQEPQRRQEEQQRPQQQQQQQLQQDPPQPLPPLRPLPQPRSAAELEVETRERALKRQEKTPKRLAVGPPPVREPAPLRTEITYLHDVITPQCLDVLEERLG